MLNIQLWMKLLFNDDIDFITWLHANRQNKWLFVSTPAGKAADQQPGRPRSQRRDHRHRGQWGGGPGGFRWSAKHYSPSPISAQTRHGPHKGEPLILSSSSLFKDQPETLKYQYCWSRSGTLLRSNVGQPPAKQINTSSNNCNAATGKCCCKMRKSLGEADLWSSACCRCAQPLLINTLMPVSSPSITGWTHTSLTFRRCFICCLSDPDVFLLALTSHYHAGNVEMNVHIYIYCTFFIISFHKNFHFHF